MANSLDAHAKPPARIREVYKEFQKAKPADLEHNPSLLQFDETSEHEHEHRGLATLPAELRQIFCDFLNSGEGDALPGQDMKERKCYEIPEIPGKSTSKNIRLRWYIEVGRTFRISFAPSSKRPAFAAGQITSPGSLQPATPNQHSSALSFSLSRRTKVVLRPCRQKPEV